MALTLGNATAIATAMRNTLADAFDNHINTTGAGTAVLRLIDSTGPTTLVTFNLQNPAFGAAASGVITLAGVTIAATAAAGAASTAETYEITDRGGTIVWTGAVTGSDTITSGQTVNLTSLTITFPAS